MNLPAAELIRRYDVAAPRYTSYPTVPCWEVSPDEAQWVGHLRRQLDAGDTAGAALYVHVPFCRALCTYCGCNTRVTRDRSIATRYVGTLLEEWRLYREALGDRARYVELHLGGGTPTFLAPEELEKLFAGLAAGEARDAEVHRSIEVDPRVTTPDHLDVLARFGFTRLSLGVQDFDPRVQDIVNRVQSEEQVGAVTAAARARGFTSVNFDLIYGLPLQTPDSIRATMAAVGRLRPDRIALYAYAHVPWIRPAQRRFTEADLPVGENKRRLYELGRELLAAQGYREIGLDHFALPEDDLWRATESGRLHRNFMGYTERRSLPLIGLGVSAIGDAWSAFAQNEKVLEKYEDKVLRGELPLQRGHVLTPEDLVLRRHILELMTRFRTSWDERAPELPFLASVGERLAPLEADGLVELAPGECRVTPLGRAFLRNVCVAFDARLARLSADAPLFSRAV